jgi:hypothetical protein
MTFVGRRRDCAVNRKSSDRGTLLIDRRCDRRADGGGVAVGITAFTGVSLKPATALVFNSQ